MGGDLKGWGMGWECRSEVGLLEKSVDVVQRLVASTTLINFREEWINSGSPMMVCVCV